MKKFIFVIVILLALCFFYFKTKQIFVGKFMSTRKVCKTWGDKPFDISRFKAADRKKDEEAMRAKMTCSLLRNQDLYIGKKPMEIRRLLGEPTGYYFNDSMPAYIIGPQKKGGTRDIWQIVFLIDDKGRTSEITVHQHCCSQYSWTARAIIYCLEKIVSFFLWLRS